MQPDLHTVKDAAQGRWPGILAAIGIPAQSLRNRHQPCPCCGGRDRYRFRFDDKDGRGTFYCSHWPGESGDGFHLVMHSLGCGLPDAVQAVAAALGMGGRLPESRTAAKPAVLRWCPPLWNWPPTLPACRRGWGWPASNNALMIG